MRPDVVGKQSARIIGLTIIAFYSLTHQELRAQTTLAAVGGRLAGYVRDSTGRPMPSAQVWIDGTALGGMADSGGRYLITDLPPGALSLTASYVGYGRVQVRGLQIAAGQSLEQDFRLAPATRDTMSHPQPQGQLVAEEEIVGKTAGDDAPEGSKLSAERIAGILVSTPVKDLPAVMLDNAKRDLISRIFGSGDNSRSGITGLAGLVTSASNQPIAGAKIEVEGTPFVLTGEDGKFLIQPQPRRKITLRISAAGYRTLEVPLEKLKSGEARRVFLKLQQ